MRPRRFAQGLLAKMGGGRLVATLRLLRRAVPMALAFCLLLTAMTVAETRNASLGLASGLADRGVTSVEGNLIKSAAKADGHGAPTSALAEPSSSRLGEFPARAALLPRGLDGSWARVLPFRDGLGGGLLSLPSGVSDTLVFANNTVVPGNFVSPTTVAPFAVATNTQDRRIYVTGAASDTVAILDARTDEVLANVSVGAYPYGIAYNSANDTVFVANALGSTVSVIDGATNRMIANVTLPPGFGPGSVTYDSIGNRIFVANFAGGGNASLAEIDGATDRVLGTISLPVPIFWISFDAIHNRVYATSPPLNAVVAVNASSGAIVANISVDGDPTTLVADSGTGDVYVVHSFNVSRISGTTNKIVANATIPRVPEFIESDSVDGRVFVSADDVANVAGSIYVLNASSLRAISNISVGHGAVGLSFAPFYGRFFTANELEDSVSVVNATFPVVIATARLGISPYGLTVDPSTGTLYVADYWSAAVEVVDATTDRVVSNLSVGLEPLQTALRPQSHSLYVILGNGMVEDVNLSSKSVRASISVGPALNGIIYDPDNDRLYVTEQGSTTVAVINPATDLVVKTIFVGQMPGGLVYDPSEHAIFVVNEFGDSVSVIDGTTNNVVTTIRVELFPVAIALDSTADRIVVASYGNRSLDVIDPKTNRVVNRVALTALPFALAHSPVDNAVYVTDASDNAVQIVDGSTWTFTKSVPVGLGPVFVAADPKNSRVFLGNQLSGSLSIFQTTAPILPVIHSFVASPPTIDLGQTTDLVVNASGGNGTLHYAYGSLPPGCASADTSNLSCIPTAAGTYTIRVTVSDSLNESASATTALSVQQPYSVTFSENGLPTATGWSVTLNTETKSSNGTTITFARPDGMYAYAIGPVDGYTPDVQAGTVSVSGGPVAVSVTWSPTTYDVIFLETGLTGSFSWSVMIQGQERSSQTDTIVVAEPNGTYGFTVMGPSGYAANPASGIVRIHAASSSTAIEFSLASPAPAILAFTATPTTVTTGSNVTLSVLTSGGLGPLTYAYGGLPFGCSSQDSATLTCTPTVAGTYSITVVVTDAASRTTSAAVSLTVGQAVASPPPMTLFGLAAWEAYVLFAVLGIAVGIGIGVAFAGRKRKRPT